MLVSDLSFRDIQHRYFLLPLQPADTTLREISKNFPGAAKANLLLVYGYIDHQAGITFELLCNGIYKKQQVSLFAGSDEFAAKIRYDNVKDHEIYPQDEYHFDPYQEKVHMIDTCYKASKEVEILRSFKDLDQFRDSQFPDDMTIILYRKGMPPEQVWVRCNTLTHETITGTLLNEPNGNLGPHCSDEITFEILSKEDGSLLPICCLDK